MQKKTILCFTSHYLPGFKNGGPVRSLLNMCEWLGEVFSFRIVTRDRDRGDTEPYEGYSPGMWHVLNGAQVQYLPIPYWAPWRLRRAVLDAAPDLLYFHSFLDPALTIMPLFLRRLGLLPSSIPVLVAPRGEFSPGAFSLKRTKKVMYLWGAKVLGLYRNVVWHATSHDEEKLIRTMWGTDTEVLTARNLLSRANQEGGVFRAKKKVGLVRLVFLSRISRKKNLLSALKMLESVEAGIVLDIYGPIEDKDYWGVCQGMIARLPRHIEVNYKESVHPEDVIPTLARYDVFIFPTLGENFGHVILEALLAGCPVILSDQTPWRNLSEKQIGFDIPLERPDVFIRAIEQFAAMREPEFQIWSRGAREYATQLVKGSDALRETRNLLDQMMMR